jgi:two-component system sensor histidine kinase VicK
MNTKTHYYHAVYENTNDAVYTTDLLGNFTSVNPAGERMTGYKRKELLNQNFSILMNAKALALVTKMMNKKIHKDVPTFYEVEIVRKDGSKLPVEINSRILKEHGKPIGILGIARDITERKVLERHKEVFYGLITHEIKTPLSAIKILSELLQKYNKSKNEKQQEYASMIMDQANKLDLLINDFLDITKMNTGKFTIDKQLFDLNISVKNVVNTFNESFSSQRIIHKGKGILHVHADRNRIEQVITNLLSNAIKYSPPDTKIIISTRIDKNIIVKVFNEGPEIPKENQKNIFELFYRLNTHQKEKIEGHGLGLYICKEIIEGHKGKIGVISNKSRGTTFHFSLPIEK